MYGPELINQASWNLEGLAWWSENTGNWFGNGVFISSNASGNLKKNDFWVIGKTYKCCFTTDYRSAGNFKPFTNGVDVIIVVSANGVYTVNVTAVSTFMILESDGYIGAVTELSVKEIIESEE